MHTPNEISSALLAAVNDFISKVHSFDAASFEASQNGKWSVGQNLDHLYRSVKPINMAFSLPRFVPRLMFGKPRNPSRTFEGVVKRYQEKLAAGGVAPSAFVPPVITYHQKEALVHKYFKANLKLAEQINGMSDETLDGILLPHPLLGKLTFREMLFFTVYHTRHHLESIGKG